MIERWVAFHNISGRYSGNVERGTYIITLISGSKDFLLRASINTTRNELTYEVNQIHKSIFNNLIVKASLTTIVDGLNKIEYVEE